MILFILGILMILAATVMETYEDRRYNTLFLISQVGLFVMGVAWVWLGLETTI